MILMSYTNARGETVVLDDTEHSFVSELYGREGVEAPVLKYNEVVYADGSTEILTISMEPREVTLYFWAPVDRPILREKLEEIKRKLIQTGARDGSWGQLMIRRPDGRPLYLNCVYTGGFDEMVREYPRLTKFTLSFRTSDPLFYNSFQTKYIIEADAADGYLYMQPLSGTYSFAADNYLSNPGGLFMMDLADTENDDSDHNPDAVYMKSAAAESENRLDLDGQKVYPTITIEGSAKNIRIVNELTGKKIEFSSSVTVDGSNAIVIETKPLHRKVVRRNLTTGAETSLISKLTADSTLDFYLERGTNVIRYRNSESTPESTCTFSYTEGFLSAE